VGVDSEFEIIKPVYSYEIVYQSPCPELNIGEKAVVYVRLKNTGNTVWFNEGRNAVYLGTSHPKDRETVFYKESSKGWHSGNRIKMDGMVYPGQDGYFVFEVVAPDKSGIYREYFNPLVEYKTWIGEDKDIYWDIAVRDPVKPDERLETTINGMPPKYIKVKIEEQKLYAYENGLQKYVFVTSTGRAGMDTPKGKFQIYNKFPTQYSSQYELFMDNWMAITRSGSHGIHALPYWKLKDGGKLYEGEDHLGTKVSHGCIRLSVSDSHLLYNWAEIGTVIFVED